MGRVLGGERGGDVGARVVLCVLPVTALRSPRVQLPLCSKTDNGGDLRPAETMAGSLHKLYYVRRGQLLGL